MGWRHGRKAVGVALVAIALAAAGCGSDGEVPTASVRTGAPDSSTISTEQDASTTTVVDVPVPSVPVTVTVPTTLTLPKVTVPKVTVPRVTVTVPPVVTSLPAPSTTESPLPVPELFDVVQGIGTPCVKTEQHPDGCFFFVYATMATRTWTHHVYSDAMATPLVGRDHGLDCGAEAQPHHTEREGCSFYFGPVRDRVAGQRECFWATTVSGGRESERSNTLCLTWTDHTTTSGSSG